MHDGVSADSVRWRNDGFFSASRSDGVRVKGVASDSETVAELLRRAEGFNSPGSAYRARPNHEVRDFGWSPEAGREAADVAAELKFQLRARRPVEMMPLLESLGREIPSRGEELVLMAQERAIDLNRNAPQVGANRVFMPPFDESDVGALGVRGSAVRGWAIWADWIASRLLVSTSSRVWNVIDREPGRDTVIRIAGWLRDAVATGGLDDWLSEMFENDPMLLNQIEGPAGPVYEVVSGTHRAHAARIWGLPYVLCRVQVDRLPRPLRPHTRIVVQLWEGLRRRGLLQADRVGDCWYLQWITAEWMLTPPQLATQWNAMYERIYPGALQEATGLTLAQLVQPDRWAQALL